MLGHAVPPHRSSTSPGLPTRERTAMLPDENIGTAERLGQASGINPNGGTPQNNPQTPTSTHSKILPAPNMGEDPKPTPSNKPTANGVHSNTQGTDCGEGSGIPTSVDCLSNHSSVPHNPTEMNHPCVPQNPLEMNQTLLTYNPDKNIKKILDELSSAPQTAIEVQDFESEEPHTPALIASILPPPAIDKKDSGVETLSEEEIEKEIRKMDEEEEANSSFDEDDAAVYLQELGINFGLSGRSSRSGRRSKVSSRNKAQSAISRLMRSPRSNGGWSVSGSSLRKQATKSLISSSLQLGRRDNGDHLFRLLSAKRNHIQELSNDVVCLHKKIKELQDKNRVLVQVCKRQEAALKKFHDAKSELPRLLEVHRMEITVLQDRVRKLTDAHKRDGSKLRHQEEKLLKTHEEAVRLRDLTKKKNLPERDELNKKLTLTYCALTERQTEVDELKRRLALTEKSGKQQLVAEESRHRATNRKLTALKRENRALQKAMQERDKELAAVQHYRSRAYSALSSKNIRGSTSNLSSSTAGMSSINRSSASSHSMKGARNRRLVETDDSGIMRSDVENKTKRTVRRTKSGRLLPPISGDPRQRRTHASDSDLTTHQMSNEWQGPWWSRNPDYDTQTYQILSSPDILSSTSPISQQEQSSPTRLAKSSIESNDSCPFASIDSDKPIVRKYTYTRDDSARKPSETESEYDKYSVDVLSNYKNSNLEDQETIIRQKGGSSTSRECNVSKSEERERFNKDGCVVEVLRTTTVTTTMHTNNRETNERVESTKCLYDLMTDTDSSLYPSPDLRCGVTLESISDDQTESQKCLLDEDRKDSNSSNMTGISAITTDSNVSTISEMNHEEIDKKISDAGSRRRSCADQFSLIENYPPKEKKNLQLEGTSGTASDTSGGGPSPPPVRAPPSAAKYRPPPSAKLSRQGSMKLSRQNSVSGVKDMMTHKHTMSLSHLEDERKSSAKPSRSAITP